MGSIICWGNGDHGELGDGRSGDSRAPVRVSSISNATALSTGITHSCAILRTGAVVCWGSNGRGGLGDGTRTDSAVPVAVRGLSGAISISAGYESSCAALSSGAVKCWGSNNRGQLGNGLFGGSRPVPTSVVGIKAATEVSIGGTHACAVLKSGAVDCWGSNTNGELGNGSTTGSTVPVSVTRITNATAVSASQRGISCVLERTGRVFCFGLNNKDQLGNGLQPTGSTTPVQVLISHALSISSDNTHSCALVSTGGAECWGYNDYGQLGLGAHAGPPAIRNPGPVAYP
jgi:alpha-tubulin suppressor-like RCC1 family protein